MNEAEKKLLKLAEIDEHDVTKISNDFTKELINYDVDIALKIALFKFLYDCNENTAIWHMDRLFLIEEKEKKGE